MRSQCEGNAPNPNPNPIPNPNPNQKNGGARQRIP